MPHEIHDLHDQLRVAVYFANLPADHVVVIWPADHVVVIWDDLYHCKRCAMRDRIAITNFTNGAVGGASDATFLRQKVTVHPVALVPKGTRCCGCHKLLNRE